MAFQKSIQKAVVPLAIVLGILFSTLGAEQLRAADLSNSLSIHNALFWSPERGHYLETAIHIHGAGLRYEEVSARRFRSRVELTILLRSGDEIFNFDKYVLESPLTSDTGAIDFALSDMRRLSVEKLPFTVEVIARDLLDSLNVNSLSESFVEDYRGGLTFSDVCFIDTYRKQREPDRFTKHGVEMIPWVPDYIPDLRNKLIFFTELYGSAEAVPSGAFLLTASIRVKDGQTINPNFWQYRKADTAVVVPFLSEFDISNLPSGNYELVIEARDRNNGVLTERRHRFQRVKYGAVDELDNLAMMDLTTAFSRKYTAPELYAYLSYISVIADQADQQTVAVLQATEDTVLQQQYLYNFWLRRDEVDPYAAWLQFLSTVKFVNSEYAAVSKQGFRTDRGRVRLQYGAPTEIISVPSEPGAKPYEIWIYNAVQTAQGTQGNVKFVFYDPSLVTNDYTLAHSNAVGELQDPRWQLKVYGSSAMPQDINNLDNEQIRQHFGGNASDNIDR